MKNEKKTWLHFIPGIIRRNGLRLFSALAVTLLIMAAVHYNSKKTDNISGIRVQFELPPPYEFESKMEPAVHLTVTVTGSETLLDRLGSDSFKAVKKITLEEIQKGVIRFSVADIIPQDTLLPVLERPKITDVSPKKMDVKDMKFYQSLKKTVPVEPKVIEALPNGYKYVGMEILSDDKNADGKQMVVIEGPLETIKEIKSVSTDPVYLRNVSKDFERKIYLHKPSKDVKLSISEFSAKIKISGPLDRDIDKVPVKALLSLPAASNITYKLEPAEVHVYFRENSISKTARAEMKDLYPFVIVDNLKDGETSCKVHCWHDNGNIIRIDRIVPESVTVTVTRPDTPQPQEKQEK